MWQAGLGLDRYDYGLMPLRQVMEFPTQLIRFSVMEIVPRPIDDYRDAQERRLSLRPDSGPTGSTSVRDCTYSLVEAVVLQDRQGRNREHSARLCAALTAPEQCGPAVLLPGVEDVIRRGLSRKGHGHAATVWRSCPSRAR